MNIQTELDLHVDRLSRAVFAPRFHALIVKFLALKDCIDDALTSRKLAYEQLMLAEIDLSKGNTDSALEKIYAAKGLLACLALVLCLYSEFSDNNEMRKTKTAVKIVYKENFAA